MKRPVWFHKDGRLHWRPCAWQGWALVAGFILFIAGWTSQFAPKSPTVTVAGDICAAAVLIAVAVWTDDTHG